MPLEGQPPLQVRLPLRVAAFGMDGARGDRGNLFISGTWGKNFADGRGNFVGTLSYQDNKAVYARDRAEHDMHLDGAAVSYGETAFFYGSSFTPNGVAVLPGIDMNNANWVYTPSTGAARPYIAATDGFNRQGQRQLYVPNSALQFSGQALYNFDDHTRFFFEGSYYRGTTKSDIEPSPVSGGDIFRNVQDIGLNPQCNTSGCLYGIPLLSAIVPDAIRDAVRARTPGLSDDQRVPIVLVDRSRVSATLAPNSSAISSSTDSTLPSRAGSLPSQSRCGARRMRAPFAPPRMSD